MYVVPPVVLLALVALVGGGWSAWLFRRLALSEATTRHLPWRGMNERRADWLTALGAFMGGGAALLGGLIFMGPLNFCPFEQGRETYVRPFGLLRINLDHALGVILLVVGAVLAHTVVMMLAMRWLRGQHLLGAPETRQGMFRGPSAWLIAAVFLTPTIAILAVFLYYPMFDTFLLSTKLSRLGAPRTIFVCMRNFNRLLSDADYGKTALVSFFLAVTIVLFSLSLSLLIAQMAYRPIKGGRIYRTLLVWPYALSPVIAGIIFQLLFHNTAGVLNHIIDTLFGFKVDWLLRPDIAPWTIVLASTWNIMGFCILFYIAGLQNVSQDLLEAAAIDGANVFQRFFRITFPLLSPITFFLVVTTTTYAFFDTYGLIDFLTAGGPVEATTTMMYEVFEVGVEARNLGSAAARSLLLFAVVIGVTIVQFRFSRGRVTYGG